MYSCISSCLHVLPCLYWLFSTQVEFFSSMGLPYHAISDAEYEELAGQLAAVLRACGEWDQAKAVASNSRGGDIYGMQDM
jgi:hypothetical protein